MLMTLEQASQLINEGKLLHISGSEALLKALPKGNWAGGSTEYFMTEKGGKVTGDLLYITELPYTEFKIKSYNENTIKNIATDAYGNGFTIVIIPFDSAVHREYARNASTYSDIFLKPIIGWISGLNLGKPEQTPVSVNGANADVSASNAVVIHVALPENKNASVNIVNIFSQDESSPLIKFKEDGFAIDKCLIDGKETVFAEYLARNKIDTNLPLVGDYSGNGINISFRGVENGIVNLYAPVFKDIDYRLSKDVGSYADAFNGRLADITAANAVFTCNCILNFLHGELENKQISAGTGPITFGEIAYQLVNQTLVYLTVS